MRPPRKKREEISAATYSNHLAGIALSIFILGIVCAPAQTIDTLVMGDDAFEKSHNLTAAFPPPTYGGRYTYPPASDPSDGPPSDEITGEMKQPARRLLPRTPVPDMYGGELDFTMKVDPVNQNYFTIKLWGSDSNENALILNCENFEIGTRHGSSAADIFVNHGGVWFPNRFWYRTVYLPLKLTQGKQTVAIKLRSAGKIYDYNKKAYTPDYQYLMKTPSWQIYQVYTHVGGFIDTTGEVNGVAAPARVRTSPGAEVVEAWKTYINGKVRAILKDGFIKEGRSEIPGLSHDIDWLAQTYKVSWTPGYHSPQLIDVIIKSIDQVVTAYAEKNDVVGGEWGGQFQSLEWGGALGSMGEAIRLLYPELKGRMSETVDFGGSLGSITRKEGWSKALRASVDAGRFHRRAITNQEIICDGNIYAANRGLELVDPDNAIAESEAIRYPYEAAGLSPYLGSDRPGEGPIPVRGADTSETYLQLAYGPNWYYVTTKGTSKEKSFVGSDYGEMGPAVYHLGVMSGDHKLIDQALKMIRSRAYFRFPSVDKDGFQIMAATEPIGVRNNYLPGHDVYVTRDVSDTGASIVAHEDAADLAGWFQEELADGQLYAIAQHAQRVGAMDNPGAPYFPDDLAAALAKVAKLKSSIKLPEAPGSPDFAWSDEENMVVAAKHGEERFFANMVWRSNLSINRAAMVFMVTPQVATRAEVHLDDIRYVPTGRYETKDDSVDEFTHFNPPDHKLYPNAEMGNRYPIAVRPDLVGHVPAQNVDGGRGTGYTLCYGHWLVGMNGNYTTGDYAMKLPPGFTSGIDLVSGKEIKAPVIIPKGTTVVFYLPEPASIPTSPDAMPDADTPSAGQPEAKP